MFRRLPYLLAALAAPIACARLAGLEDPDPVTSGQSSSGGTGTTSNGTFSMTPATIALTASCNGSAPEQTLVLANLTSGDLPYQLQVPDGSRFSLRGEDGTTGLSLQGTLHRSMQVHFVVDTKKAGARDGVVIATVGETTLTAAVKVTVNGGALELSPTLIDFGEVRKDKVSAPQTFELRNTGTDAVNVLGFSGAGGGDAGTDFDVTLGAGTGSVNIIPGGVVQGTVVVTAGADNPQPIQATVQPTTQSPTCGDLPTLALQGKRVNDDVTVNPVALDFGDVDCASPGGAAQTVTISNYGRSDASFTVTTDPASWFSVSPASGTVPKGDANPGTTAVTLTLKPVTNVLGGHQETIAVAITGAQTKTTNLTVTANSVGAVLAIQPTSLSLDKNDSKSFVVANLGNKFVFVNHASSSSNFAISANQSALFPNLPVPVGVKWNGSGGDSASADIMTSRVDTPALAPLPKSANLCTAAPIVKARAASH